ncbi:MAG: N-acetylmuramidase domain-containing protein [Sedimenticola sp.]|nr:N-acetylmuramidase domain-containing protein [Sedimenticola sp.]MCW8976435.1 N-acetylmuramidase domain-containing protein [Sedimenticola sp.]MCW9022324.1 N-acetylmuramidase domain-containing protein [Sedimenticola sp.]
MDVTALVNDPVIRKIVAHPDDDTVTWQSDLQRFLEHDIRLTRRSVGESAISAVQRLLIFLGYSTSASGAFSIDGDFGRGTNRAVAQFQFEHQLSSTISRKDLCYPCQWNTAKKLITSVPEATLTEPTLTAMLSVAKERCKNKQIMTGELESALFHLNALHRRRFLNCREILEHYGQSAQTASEGIREQEGITVRAEWILAIIRQETAGVIRPRFEQHYLSRLNRNHPEQSLPELRMQSMSLGLGQIMGTNYQAVGASNATALFTAPVEKQVIFVGEFLKPRESQTRKGDPTTEDFRKVARFYNGPQYAAHLYHEQLARWFREFRLLM